MTKKMLLSFYAMMLPTLRNNQSVALHMHKAESDGLCGTKCLHFFKSKIYVNLYKNFYQKQKVLQSKNLSPKKVFIFKCTEEYSIFFTDGRE